MAISVNIQDFTDALNDQDGNTTSKTITTAASVKNKDILVLGGIIRNAVAENITSVPILGDIPLVGWLFKNKSKSFIKNNLLIFIAPQIITPKMIKSLDVYTDQKFAYSQQEMNAMNSLSNQRDPINRTFFDDASDATDKQMLAFAKTDPGLNRRAQMRQSKVDKQKRERQKIAEATSKSYRRNSRKNFLNNQTIAEAS